MENKKRLFNRALDRGRSNKMPIRIGFVVFTSSKWFGGVSYYRNLLNALSKVKSNKIQPILFVGTEVDKKTLRDFEKFGTIVKTNLLNRNTLLGKINAVMMSLFCRSFFMLKLFKDNKISLVSHSNFVTNDKSIRTINWIPDFQHVYMPEMFSVLDRAYRSLFYGILVRKSDSIVLISNTERKHFSEIYPKYADKANALRFVSGIDKNVYSKNNIEELMLKYKFTGKYFFFPAQLWKHKNHMVVIKALNQLKKENKNILVLCSGYMHDYRNSNYSKSVLEYVKTNKLENNIRFLGMVDREDISTLMRYSVSVINPSFYEGWSTVVEEVKSIGKDIVLSDIKVHREQDPPASIFFNPNDSRNLAKILWNMWVGRNGRPNKKLETLARKKINQRVLDYGKAYEKLVISTAKI